MDMSGKELIHDKLIHESMGKSPSKDQVLSIAALVALAQWRYLIWNCLAQTSEKSMAEQSSGWVDGRAFMAVGKKKKSQVMVWIKGVDVVSCRSNSWGKFVWTWSNLFSFLAESEDDGFLQSDDFLYILIGWNALLTIFLIIVSCVLCSVCYDLDKQKKERRRYDCIWSRPTPTRNNGLHHVFRRRGHCVWESNTSVREPDGNERRC